jgi:PAS domain S-box-containing protein
MAGGVRVLYVDDEPGLHDVVREFLEMGGEFSVDTTLSAPAALGILATTPYDAIVSDYHMPKMDGIEFLKRVRESDTTIPFILFTGKGREEVVIEAINNGATFYLQKGGDPEAQFAELGHKIRQSVRSRRAELERMRSEEKFSRLFIANPSLEAITDLTTGRLVDVNDAFTRTTGYSREELIGKSTREIDLFVDYPRRERMIQATADNGLVQTHGTRIKTKSGTIRILDFTVQRIRAGDNELLFSQAVDVTDWKRAEDELHKSEERFRTIVETFPDLIWEIDTGGKIQYVSPVVSTILGYMPEDLAGKPITNLIPGPERQFILRELARFMAAEGPRLPLEVPVLHRDGHELLLEIRPSKITGADGTVTGSCGFARDITERKIVEEALSESEARFRTLFENSNDAMTVHGFTPEGMPSHFIDVNENACRLTGYTREELLSMSALELDDPATWKEARSTMQELMQRGELVFERNSVRKDGQKIRAEISAHIFRLDNRKVLLSSIRDITGRKLAEGALAESEEKYRSFVENVNEIVFSLDPKGTFTYLSPKITELLGYEPREFIGKTCKSLIHPDDLPACLAVFRRTMQRGEKISGLEYRIRHKDGTWSWHSQSASAVRDASGTIVAFQGICHDVTGRKNAEEALQQANKKLSLLSGITRHDINNQLLTVDGFISILKRKAADPSLDPFFSRITIATRQIASLIRFTKEYEKIGMHAPVWQDLRALVDGAGADVLQGKIALSNDLPAGMEVFADPLIAKVFFNLLDNAQRHGGKITTVRFSLEEQNGSRIIVCADDGDGVPADEKERIFERGFGKNTGFGLAISREILDITGLAITETGKSGTGARFEIAVPKGQCRILS